MATALNYVLQSYPLPLLLQTLY